MQINLHGPNGTRSRRVSKTSTAPMGPSPDPSEAHRKSCFACVRRLDVEAHKFWDCIKKHYHVESRSNLTVQQWAELSASLQAALRNPKLRTDVLNRIGYHEPEGSLRPPVLDTVRIYAYQHESTKTFYAGPLSAEVMHRASECSLHSTAVVRLFYKDRMHAFTKMESWEYGNLRFYRVESQNSRLSWMEFKPTDAEIKYVGGARNFAILKAITENVRISVTDALGHEVFYDIKG